MNIISILAGIEKLVVELLLWLIFIPKTLFKIISDPNWVSKYVDEELEKKSDKFVNFISPIMLFLVSSVVLFFIFENTGFDGNESFKAEKLLKDLKGTAGLLAGLGFLSLPLLFGLATEYFKKTKLTQQGIQRILYIQCYYFSPLILSFFVLSLFGDLLPDDEIVITIFSVLILLGILIWFLIVEINLISKELQSGKFKAIAVFTGSIIVFILGISFLVIASEGGKVDSNDAGVTEEISELVLPHDGKFSIIISDFEYKEGEYRLILKDSISTSMGEEELIQNYEDNMLSNGTIDYGQFIYGYVAKGDSSKWIFNGAKDDRINIIVEPIGEMDVVFDVKDENGKTIIEPVGADYTTLLGYLYVLIFGWGILRGFRSMFRKPETSTAVEEKSQIQEQ